MKVLIALFLALVSGSQSLAQSFQEDPLEAIDASAEIARQAIEQPLAMFGLQTVIFQYNRARLGFSPAGYESEEWLFSELIPVLGEVRTEARTVEEVQELSEEETAAMLDAWFENGDSFFGFYETIRFEAGLGEVTAEEMLSYLAAYAIVANSVEQSLWDRLSAITGVWPLCFWNG